MEPRIATLTAKKFIGKCKTMSFSNNKTEELWRSFMPGRKDIPNNVGLELYSIEVYNPAYFDNFNPDVDFEKWAAVEVTDFHITPEGMKTMTSQEGVYAVFVHKGPASVAPRTYRYIFQSWLPHSDFLLDARPHFAIMGQKYKNNDPDSEEELWIPVKPKNNAST